MDAEHFEPVQSLTQDRRGRTRNLVVTLIPALLLVAVIGAGIFGGGAAGEESAPPSERAAAASVPPSIEPSLAPDALALEAAGFPPRALGLPVRSVARTLGLRETGELGNDVVAVAGWLSIPPVDECGADVVDTRVGLYGTGSSCRRWTILAADAEPVLAVRDGLITTVRDVGHALWPQGLPGLSLASIAAVQIAPDNIIRPSRAVILGRFADPRLPECETTNPACHATFAIERVAWVDGDWRLRRPEIFPARVEADPSGIVRWPTIDTAIRRGAIVLGEVIATRGDLAALDPAADAATPADAGTVWYVRALLRQRGVDDPTGEVGWAVIADDTGEILASEPERIAADAGPLEPLGSPPASPPEPDVSIPARMLGEDVLDVSAARELALGGIEPDRLVVVDGWLTVAPDEPGCTDLPVVACPRRGHVSSSREPGGVELAVETLPGTPLLGLTRQNPSLGTWTVPNRVVLVGRFRNAVVPCDREACQPVLTIERLAWLRTALRQRPVLTAPGNLPWTWTPEEAERVALAAIDGAGPTLLVAFVDRATLARLDPAATDAIGPAGPPVWYVRLMAWRTPTGSGGVPVLGWAVIDNDSHRVLAGGLWNEPS